MSNDTIIDRVFKTADRILIEEGRVPTVDDIKETVGESYLILFPIVNEWTNSRQVDSPAAIIARASLAEVRAALAAEKAENKKLKTELASIRACRCP